MTATVEEDFGGFVAARWPDLEAVALAATLDPAAARAATTESLAALRPGWAATLDSGSPTTEARRALLARLTPAPRRRPAPTRETPRTPPAPVDPRLHAVVEHPTSTVPTALLDALAGRSPLARALLAGGAVWELADGELLGLLRPDGAPAPDLDGERAALLEAHRSAREADGLGPADHLLDDDVADLVHRLAAGQPEPPDPAGLVVERARRVRRRSLVAGGGAALLVAGATGWVLREREATPAARPSPVVPTTAGPDDPAWASSARWPARGALAGDLDVQALVARAGPGTRLLWAADLADLRVVVAATSVEARPESTSVRAWTGPPGAAATGLTEAALGFDAVLGVQDLVAVGLERPGGAALVVLTRPTVRSADFSPVVRLTAAGAVERRSTRLALADGIGTLLLPGPWGTAARLRSGDYAGPPVSPEAWGSSRLYRVDGDPLDTLLDDVASATGIARTDLRGEVLVDSPTDGSVLDPTAVSATGGDGRAVLTRVRTPDGAVVRGLDVRDDGRAGGTFLSTSPLLVPADQADAPLVLPLDGGGDRAARFLVVVPSGGATCRLLTDVRGGGPASEDVPMKRRTAVVSVDRSEPAAGALRLVVRDAAGRVTYDDVPPAGRDLTGDAEEGTGWLGLPLPYET